MSPEKYFHLAELDFSLDRAKAYNGTELVATMRSRLPWTETEPVVSDFNEIVLDIMATYPTDGSCEYYWPQGSGWLVPLWIFGISVNWWRRRP